jgi:hypothetical protein
MTIQELLDLSRNRLATLSKQRDYAWSQGDATMVASLDESIATTQITITTLEGLV